MEVAGRLRERCRSAGSEYNLKATAYIAAEVKRMGLLPAGDSGSYFQNVPLAKRELDPKVVTARQFVETLLKHGVLSKDTHGTVARFAPALIVTREELDWGVQRICDALREYGPAYEKAA